VREKRLKIIKFIAAHKIIQSDSNWTHICIGKGKSEMQATLSWQAWVVIAAFTASQRVEGNCGALLE